MTPALSTSLAQRGTPQRAPVALEEDDQLAGASVRPRAICQRPCEIPQWAFGDAGLQTPRPGVAAVAFRHEAVGLPAVVALLLGSVRGPLARPLVVQRDDGHEAEGQGGQQQAVRPAMDVHAGTQPGKEGANTGCSCGADRNMTPRGHA